MRNRTVPLEDVDFVGDGGMMHPRRCSKSWIAHVHGICGYRLQVHACTAMFLRNNLV
jgi:hypothetical protein